MRACARGDERAFALVHGRLSSRVCARLRQITGSAADAEELTQDVFMLVWCEAARYDPLRAPLDAWVLSIAHHRAVTLVRRRGAEGRSHDRLHAGAAGVAEDDLADLAEHRRTVARCRRTIARLPLAQRETVRLAFVEDLSYAEIARVTDVPLSTVKSRVRLALRHLRAALGER